MKILLIIPAYNESHNLQRLIKEIEEYRLLNHLSIDTLIVNDGSTDNTKSIHWRSPVKMINFCYNLGIGAAVECGLQYANEYNYDIAIQIDGDGQHPPSELNKLLNHYKKYPHYDLIVGSRYVDESDGFKSSKARRAGIKILRYNIYILSGLKIYDTTSGFRLFNKRAIEYFSSNYPDEFPEPESLLIAKMIGLNVTEIGVCMRERIYGASSISRFKSLYYMIKVVLSLFFTYLRIRYSVNYGLYNK